MEASSLEFGVKHLNNAGNTLNVYELTSLQVALLMLQQKEGKEKAYFWGRIRGQQADYYIAYTLEESDYIYPKKKMFFRFDTLSLNPKSKRPTQSHRLSSISNGLGEVVPAKQYGCAEEWVSSWPCSLGAERFPFKSIKPLKEAATGTAARFDSSEAFCTCRSFHAPTLRIYGSLYGFPPAAPAGLTSGPYQTQTHAG